MARIGNDSGSAGVGETHESLTYHADGQDRIELPSADFIADAKMTRDGDNLILQTPNGETAVIEGYFNADPAPLLHSADGATLTPNLVDAFSRSPYEFAAKDTASDESPVGAVEEVKGNATVTRADGTVETITIGTPIYQGDVIETDASGAVNITFIDETSMAVSENARLAIDEYTFDPATESGTTNFSVLRGLFVFTSGLIGRDDPDDVTIDTPVGSIGIRGTVIAGDINPAGQSKITVLEGAIVVTNGSMEVILSEQFQTVRLGGFDQPMHDMGVVPANDIGSRFHSIGDVNPSLFTTINDAAKEQAPTQQNQPAAEQPSSSEPTSEQQSQETAPSSMDTGLSNSLTGDSSGLPSQSVTSGGMTGTTSSTGGSTAPTGSAPPPSGTTGGTTQAAPAPTSTETPLPPPSNTTGSGGTTTTAPALTLAYAAGVVTDVSTEHTLVGTVTGSAGMAGATYAITSGNSAYFDLVTTSNGVEIHLSQAGEDFLGDSLDVRQMGAITVEATLSGGQTVTRNFTTNVTDANASSTINANGPVNGSVSVISDGINNEIGYSITALGDVNNDGFADFAFTNNSSNTSQNHTYVVFGSAGAAGSTAGSSLSGSIADLALGPRAEVRTNPTVGSDPSTSVVAGIGDFNGDGYEDYIVGQQHNGLLSTGTFTIVSGTGAVSSTTSIILSASGGIGAGDLIGASVSGIGDLNNDGYQDVIVGAPGTASGSGKVFIYEGRPDISTDITSTTAMSPIAGDPGSSFGRSVIGLGDFDGDGKSDFAVGAPTMNTNSGAVYIYTDGPGSTPIVIGGTTNEFLGESLFNLGDINGDGKTDLLIGGDTSGNILLGGTGAISTTLDTGPDYTVTGGGAVGDFNGDGYDDFSLSLAKNDGSGGTSVFVVYGKDLLPGTIDIQYLKNSDNAFEIKYAGANNSYDMEVSGIGDVNGDGYDDFAMSVPDANGAATGNGGMAIIYGRNTGSVTTGLQATADDQSLVGNASDNILRDGDQNGISMRGGAGNDVLVLHNSQFLGIDGGTGTDLLSVEGNLDFSGVDYEKMSGIEYLEYADMAPGQTITLSVENIFNLLKSSDTGTFKIESNAGNILNITGGASTISDADQLSIRDSVLNSFGSGASMGTNTADFEVFDIGGYKLYIDVDLTVNVQS